MTTGCIYVILCNITKKVYVGATINPKRRWNTHKRTLRKNKHHSKKLQNAWNKYGENSFSFNKVEEFIDEDILVNKEQSWIDNLNSYYQGYNGRAEAETGAWAQAKNSKKYILRFLDGQEKEIKNLTRYCRNNNLNQGAMSAVARHESNHHHHIHCRLANESYEEWQKLRKNKIASKPPKKTPRKYHRKGFIVIDPYGKEFYVTSLEAFCKQNGLSQGNMSEIAYKHKRQQHKGYKCRLISEKILTNNQE